MFREKRTGEKISSGLSFERKLSGEEAPWDELLKTGTFSEATLAGSPGSWCVSSGWTAALEASVSAHGATWLHHLHLGVAKLEAGDFSGAREYFSASLARVALSKNDFAFVRAVLGREFVSIRESELTTTGLWSALQIKEAEHRQGRSLTHGEKEQIELSQPPPYPIDFRMR